MSIHSIKDYKRRITKSKWADLAQSDLNLKISVLCGQKLFKILGKYSHMLFVKSGDSMGKELVGGLG